MNKLQSRVHEGLQILMPVPHMWPDNSGPTKPLLIAQAEAVVFSDQIDLKLPRLKVSTRGTIPNRA